MLVHGKLYVLYTCVLVALCCVNQLMHSKILAMHLATCGIVLCLVATLVTHCNVNYDSISLETMRTNFCITC